MQFMLEEIFLLRYDEAGTCTNRCKTSFFFMKMNNFNLSLLTVQYVVIENCLLPYSCMHHAVNAIQGAVE